MPCAEIEDLAPPRCTLTVSDRDRIRTEWRMLRGNCSPAKLNGTLDVRSRFFFWFPCRFFWHTRAAYTELVEIQCSIRRIARLKAHSLVAEPDSKIN